MGFRVSGSGVQGLGLGFRDLGQVRPIALCFFQGLCVFKPSSEGEVVFLQVMRCLRVVLGCFWGHFMFSLFGFIRDPIYTDFSESFKGQPRVASYTNDADTAAAWPRARRHMRLPAVFRDPNSALRAQNSSSKP